MVDLSDGENKSADMTKERYIREYQVKNINMQKENQVCIGSRWNNDH